MRLPRWLADQIRDAAKADGLEESWEALLRRPNLVIPTPVPQRYLHHGPAIGTGPVMISGVSIQELLAELAAMGIVAEPVGDFGVQLPGINRRFRSAGEVESAVEANRQFRVSVLEAAARVAERGAIRGGRKV